MSNLKDNKKIFFIDPNLRIVKTYDDFFKDLNTVDPSDVFLQENDTFLFFVKLIKKIILNEDCIILDSDFEKQELKHDRQIDVAYENRIVEDFGCFVDFLNRIKTSTSEISIFTSGTTGKPKKVIHSIQTLTRAVKNKKEIKSCIWAFAYNPTHIAGIQVFFQALFNENTLIDVYRKSRTTIYDAFEKYRVSHISATPTFYRLLFPFEREFMDVLRITFGGEKSELNLHEKVQKIFPNAKVTNIYASTELGTLLYSNGEIFTIPENLKNDILIKDNELHVRTTLLGKSEDLVVEGGLYRTGDIVEIISTNPIKFIFKTRVGDYVNVGGSKVNIQEVEEVLSSIDGILIASVSVKSNSILGNILIGNVVSDFTNGDLTEKYIKTILRDKLQSFKIPRIIKIVKELDYTRTGKILKK